MPDIWSFDTVIEMIVEDVEEMMRQYWKEEPTEGSRVMGPWIGLAMDAFAEEIAARVERAVVDALVKKRYEIV
jgi:hypothetical protein